MAYRFAANDYVEFAITPFVGSLDAVTWAALFMWTNHSVAGSLISFNNASLTSGGLRDMRVGATDHKPYYFDGTNFPNGSQVMSSTTTWYLLAFTKAAGSGVTPRFHVHDGTSWVHAAGAANVNSLTFGGTDRLRAGIARATSNPFVGDIVCVGIKKADSADATVENLSRTAFSAWNSFGFDWLIGFDTSFQSAGVLQDQGTIGTGDETSKSGTSVVSNPPSWSYSTAVTPAANFTGTPLSGAAPMLVTFTDTSTNVPTSWAWDFGDGGTSTSQNPTHTYTVAGAYTVTLVATNAAGSDSEVKTGYVSVAEDIVYAAGGGIEIH